MIIVGLHVGHNASVCIMRDGEIIAAASEERFNRKKNTNNFPKQALNYCLLEANASPQKVDLFVRGFQQAEGYITDQGVPKISRIPFLIGKISGLLSWSTYKFPKFGFFLRYCFDLGYKYILTPYFQRQFKNNLSKYLNIDPKKIIFADHHLSHAYAAYYGFVPSEQKRKPYLVVTFDGEGDGLSGTVNMVKKGNWKMASKTLASNSIGKFYETITAWLGMKPNEHEYKVMGLAPYASLAEIEKVYSKLSSIFNIGSDLSLRSKIPTGSLYHYFKSNLIGLRFDGIAGAAQKYVENLTCDFIKRAVKKTKIANIAVAGGFFMNVKVNQKIVQMKEIATFYPCPSAADESTIFGAAYYGYKYLNKKKNFVQKTQEVKSLYLGPHFSDEEINDAIKSDNNKSSYRLYRFTNIESLIAKLLSEGYIVARFAGRMEFGARALGNRSILMNPSLINLKRKLNDLIKSRDFWMPFAATILDKYADDYLTDTKKIAGKHMMITYNTKKEKRDDISAAIHPYDYTCRAQVLSKEDNPEYYKLISEFKSLTNIGAVLNTSFNFHGEPIVCSPQDALNTFSKTGLEYLAIGHFLLKKKKRFRNI